MTDTTFVQRSVELVHVEFCVASERVARLEELVDHGHPQYAVDLARAQQVEEDLALELDYLEDEEGKIHA